MRIPIPKEHGAWAMVVGPALLGLLTGSPGWGTASALLGAFLSAFCAQHVAVRLITQKPRVAGLGRWLWFYLGATTVFSSGLILQGGHRSLLGFGLLATLYFAIHVWMMKRPGRREHRSLGFEVLTVAVLCLGAPAGAEVAGTGLGPEAWLAYVGAFAFYAGSVFHVRTVLRRARLRPGPGDSISRISIAWESMLWHGAIAVGLIGLTLRGETGAPWYWLAFSLPVVRAFWAVRHLPEPKWTIRQIGLIETACTVAWLLGSAALVH